MIANLRWRFVFVGAAFALLASRFASAQTLPPDVPKAPAKSATAAPAPPAPPTPPAAPQVAAPQVTAKKLLGEIVPKFDEKKYADVDKAIEAVKKGQTDEARKLLKAAKAADKSLPPEDVMLAEIAASFGDGAFARAEYDRAVLDSPEDPEPYLVFGEGALREHRLTDAELLLREAGAKIKDYKDNPLRLKRFQIAHAIGVASTQEGREQWPKAQEMLNQWLKLDPKAGAAEFRLGQVLFFQKKYKEAREAFTAAHALDGGLPLAQFALANMYAQAGDKKSAKDLVDDAVKQNPKDAVVALTAANLAFQDSDLKEAQRLADAALAADPKSLDALLLSGNIARNAGSGGLARQRFEAALKQSPKNPTAMMALALILADDKSKIQQAKEYATENAKQNPRSSEAAIIYAWVQYKAGQKAEAMRALQVALATKSISTEGAYYAAMILGHEGQKAEAQGILKKAIDSGEIFPQRAQAIKELEQMNAKSPALGTPKAGK